jgi:hypothetical protein
MLRYPVAKEEIPSASCENSEDILFTCHPSEDLREEALRLTKLAENTKDIITMENTVLVKGQRY